MAQFGRAAVSKTAGCGFESLLACIFLKKMKNHKIKKITIITISILIVLLTLINILIKNKIFMLVIILSMFIASIIILLKNKKSEILELKSEIKSIVWPDKKEVNQTMLTVTIIIISSSLIIWLIDSMLTFLISKII